MIASKMKKFFPSGFWVYVDDGDESKAILQKLELFSQAGMVTVYDIYRDGKFNGSDVTMPRLFSEGEVFARNTLKEFIEHLESLNNELLKDEGAA